MKIFLANGCSNTAGSEMRSDDMRYCHELSWPQWVSEHYGYRNINIAEPGSSNEQINRSTIVYVSNLIKTVDPKDLVVGILWSGFDRYEFWSKETDNFKSLSMTSRMYNNMTDQTLKKYIEYRSLIETEEYSYYKNLYYIYNTALFLESHNIEYYFANCMHVFLAPDILNASENFKQNYANLLSLYGSRGNKHLGFGNGDDVYIRLLRQVPRSPLGSGMHWGEDGQKKYAEHFIQHMERVNANAGN